MQFKFDCFFHYFSDPAVKQFLLHLDEKMILGKKFVIDDLDETHLFVSAEIVPVLQEEVWKKMDSNSFNPNKSTETDRKSHS